MLAALHPSPAHAVTPARTISHGPTARSLIALTFDGNFQGERASATLRPRRGQVAVVMARFLDLSVKAGAQPAAGNGNGLLPGSRLGGGVVFSIAIR